MELQLKRHDYLQVGTASRKAMKVLPRKTTKKQQKVVVGDHDGVVSCFGVKKGEASNVFKTLPLGGEIWRTELGGLKGNSDKIFVSVGMCIRALSKKGKEFLRFNAPVNEPIRSFCTKENNLWVGGEYYYNHFVDCKDKDFLMCNDKINDICMAQITSETEWNSVLACQDRTLRIVSGSNLVAETFVDSAVSVVSNFNPKVNDSSDSMKYLLYGTESGQVGLIACDKSGLRRDWVIPNVRKLGGITSIAATDITKDDVTDIVVGRDDGTIEIYGFDVSPDPQLIFEKAVGESIQSIESGFVLSAKHEELVVSTYSGKVFGYTSDPNADEIETKEFAVELSLKGVSRSVSKHATKNITSLRSELDSLREKVMKSSSVKCTVTNAVVQVEKEKAKYKEISGELVATQQQFRVNDKFTLNPEDASYTLQLEIEMPIEMVALHSDVPMDLLDVDANVAIVSKSPANPEEGSHLLATYRVQEPTNRLIMKVRSVEGQFGTLTAFITPSMTPKSCQARTYPVRPLSLHQRLPSVENMEQLPLSEFKVSGDFSLPQIHSWIEHCLPEVPGLTGTDAVTLYFQSTFLGTVLLCQYRAGSGVFISDSITTLAIIKDVVTTEATKKKLQLKTSQDIKDDSAVHMLQLIDPLLTWQLNLAKKYRMTEALKEISMHESDVSFLTPDSQDTLQNMELIRAEFKLQPRKLQVLHKLIFDLYVDKFKFRGVDVTRRLSALNSLLQNYDLIEVITFFTENVH